MLFVVWIVESFSLSSPIQICTKSPTHVKKQKGGPHGSIGLNLVILPLFLLLLNMICGYSRSNNNNN